MFAGLTLYKGQVPAGLGIVETGYFGILVNGTFISRYFKIPIFEEELEFWHPTIQSIQVFIFPLLSPAENIICHFVQISPNKKTPSDPETKPSLLLLFFFFLLLLFCFFFVCFFFKLLFFFFFFFFFFRKGLTFE